jgi:S-DNA-T family DNA segregation ATPase FtsK/SpoIIIE
MSPDEDATLAFERMSREITGSIFALIALFLLVALTSYIPLDTLNVFLGHWDRVHNLGGIVGAFVGEWCLGTFGIAGYTFLGLTGWLAFVSYRGVSLKNCLLKIVGVCFGTALAAVLLHVIFADRMLPSSLLLGGWVGKHVGGPLRLYFNTAGAILLVGGGFVFTFILTTGMSLTAMVRSVFESRETEPDDEESLPARPIAPRPLAIAVKPAAAAAPAKRSRPRRAKAAKPDADGSAGVAALDDNEGDDSLSLADDSGDGDSPDLAGSAPAGGGAGKMFEFEPLIPFTGNYQLPSLRLLKNAEGGVKRLSKNELRQNAQRLCEHLLSFQITGEVVDVTQGPVLITYEFKPSAGIKLSKIANLQDDLGIVMGTRELRIIAPIPGKTVVGIEVPRPQAETIGLKEVLAEDAFFDKKIRIPVALGKTTDGKAAFGDLAAMPHLLVAGATGSGKSVFVNSLIMSFLFRLTPQQLRLILVDPKMLELSVFDGIPHLITNVITDNRIAINAVSWAVLEMDRRYALMAQTNSKNIDSYNSKMKSAADKLPFIVVVVDELADLMMSGGEMVEIAITRLAQKARAAGIHLVIATQRPSTDVVTGLIKANIPSRLAFKVPSGIDSRTVLDCSGAEELIGRGDSLMIQPAIPLRRLHGTFVTEDELARVVKFVKGGKNHSPLFIDFSGQAPE